MPSSGHRFDVKMSARAFNTGAAPEAVVVINLRKQLRRLQVSSEGILSGVGTTNLEAAEGRFCCPLGYLELPELSNHCFRDMVFGFNVHPQILDGLVAEMVRKGCAIVGRALAGGVRRLIITADVLLLETMILGYEEDEPAWAVRESLDSAGRRRGLFGQPASRRSNQSLRRCKYGRRYSEQSTCSICLDEFSLSSSIVQMPCSHIFHDRCITRWLEQSRVCPLCRFALPA